MLTFHPMRKPDMILIHHQTNESDVMLLGHIETSGRLSETPTFKDSDRQISEEDQEILDRKKREVMRFRGLPPQCPDCGGSPHFRNMVKTGSGDVACMNLLHEEEVLL
jgi:hypothetical protein